MKKTLLLCLILLVALFALSVTALAAEGDVAYKAPNYVDDDATKGIADWNAGGVKIASDYTEVVTSAAAVTWGVADEEHWYVVKGNNVSISGGVTIAGDVHLILADGCSLTISDCGENVSGIFIPAGDNSLTIYGSTLGTGTLTATGENFGQGIGSQMQDFPEKGLTVNGGVITANGGTKGSGIGGFFEGLHLHIIINGGTVNANGGSTSGPGIGCAGGGGFTGFVVNGGTVNAIATTTVGSGSGIGGCYGWCGYYYFNGGFVTATGAGECAGIGPESGNVLERVYITGGTIIATGGVEKNNEPFGGPGIGGNCSEIVISGDIVTDYGGKGCAGIGGSPSFFGHPDGITITGGDITAIGGEPYSDDGYGISSGIGSGSSDGENASKNILISKDMYIIADNVNPPAAEVENDGTDLGTALFEKRYVRIYSGSGSVEYTIDAGSWDGLKNMKISITLSNDKSYTDEQTLNTHFSALDPSLFVGEFRFYVNVLGLPKGVTYQSATLVS